MFTQYDKAIAAVIGALLSTATVKWALPAEWASPEVVMGLSTLIIGFLTYIVPNKEVA